MTMPYRRLLQLLRSDRGSVFLLVAAAGFLLVTATGVAVDMARAQTLQTRIASALDAAGLAAGATTTSVPTTNNPATGTAWTQAQWVQAQAQKYFDANFPSGYMGAATVAVNATYDSTTNIVSLTASTTMPTTVLQAVGIASVNVGATSQITRQNTGMELALVLDNTGSMADAVNSGNSGVPKICALKCALAGNGAVPSGDPTCTGNHTNYCTANGQVTTGLLNILYGSSTSLSDLFISLVPFSDVVHIPTSQDQLISAGPGGGSCVSARSTTTASSIDPAVSVTYEGNSYASSGIIYLDESEDPPVSTSGSAFDFTAVMANTQNHTSCKKSNGQNCSQGSNGCTCTTTTTTTYSASPNCPVASLAPLTGTESTIVSGIQAMTPNGSTMINLGMAWGWRTLSPNWQSAWSGLPGFTENATNYTLPLHYPNTSGAPANMLKVVILMTDGMNTTDTSYSAYGAVNASPNNSVTALDNETLAICQALKNNGVIIYTIGFGQNGNNNPSDPYSVNGPLLQACASQSSYYFLAPTNAELASVFQQIGNQLANLRVSQ